tara:strand:- start:20917 stop:21870 length:954 start_codon:yes stop_codon:yes gene_type:complete
MDVAGSDAARIDAKRPAPQFCYSGDVRIAVCCQGQPSKPNIVLVHGYPDNNSVWDLLVDYLVDDFYIIRYDVRGAGLSSAPSNRNGYSLALLQADLAAVTAQFCSRPQFHLVGHDWGSVQSWESVCSPNSQHKILSYTSISGPCLDHVGYWFRQCWGESGSTKLVIHQIFRSWYIWFFHIPLLAPMLWRVALGRNWRRLMRFVEGVNIAEHALVTSAQRKRDGVNGIELYRANCLPRFRAPQLRSSVVPVQLIIPAKDRFLGANLYDGLSQWAPNLCIRHVEGGHWLPLSRPKELARLVADFITDGAFHTDSAIART